MNFKSYTSIIDIVLLIIVFFAITFLNTMFNPHIEEDRKNFEKQAQKCIEIFTKISFKGEIVDFNLSKIRSCNLAVIKLDGLTGDTSDLRNCTLIKRHQDILYLYIQYIDINYKDGKEISEGFTLEKLTNSNQINVYDKAMNKVYSFPIEHSLGNTESGTN